MVLVPQHQKKPVADTEMTMHSRAMLLTKTDIVTVRVALGATAKATMVLLPTMRVSPRGTIGGKEACPFNW